MFTLDAKSELSHFLSNAPWSFVGCASFEERWVGLAELADSLQLVPSRAVTLYPIDTGSAYELQCSARQQASWSGSRANNQWNSTLVNVELLGSAPWLVIRDALEAAFADAQAPRRMVIDVTAMPRLCMFSVVEWALRQSGIDELTVSYTEPISYGSGPLHSEPTGATVVPPFDHLPATTVTRQDVSWIPILGFGPTFAREIFEAISSDYELGESIYPIIGFPAFDPSFFERCVADSSGVFENNGIVHTQFRYACASDPFETRDVITRLMDATPPGHLWIGSPMGPKPMNLGMMLAAVDKPLTIMINQARTYHPDYSRGIGPTHMYVLREQGRRTY